MLESKPVGGSGPLIRARARLVKRGLVRWDGERGEWRLTDAGHAECEALLSRL